MHRLTLSMLIAACCLGSAAPALANVGTEVRTAATPAPPRDSWPQLLHDNAHTSVSPDTTLSSANAGTLGVKWMSAMRSADLGSPVVAPNASLNETLVYVGDERGDMLAFNQATGAQVWGHSIGIGNSERSTPLVAQDGSIWTASANSSPALIVKLDGSSGAELCRLTTPIHLNSSIMLATPPGGVPTIYTGTNHTTVTNGVEISADESSCKQNWAFSNWETLSGAWATAAYGVDVHGNGRIFVGSADPDSTEYALDASTGAEIWNYSALNPPDGEYDIGAAATVSPPGNNGFADGVVYFPSKYGVLYALDLTTGALIWQYNFNESAKTKGGGRSAAALYKTDLVYGTSDGVEAVNALTGTLLWHYKDKSGVEVLSSPAITGPSGSEIVTFADASGLVTVLSLANGSVLYTYQTGNYVTASPAIVNGTIIIASSDGFLYEFAKGGTNVAPPKTVITSPVTNSTLGNPGSTVTLSGTATAPTGSGVSAVQLSIQRAGPNGPWFDAATGAWAAGAFVNVVPVATKGATESSWSFALPVLGSGASYQVTANAITTFGQADRTGAQTTFTVAPTSSSPQLTLSSAFAPPGSTFTVSGGPFANGETVDFALNSGPTTKAKASSTGQIGSFTITVPATSSFGLTTLTASGETSHDASSTSIDVENFWTQSGYNPQQTNYEPNDPTLADSLQATDAGYLSVAWTFASGTSAETAAAVAAGTAYVANAAGALTAVDTYAGTPLWTYVVPDAAPIVGAPAIDVAAGELVMGGDDGNLYQVATATGSLLGTFALDGVPTSPAIANGTIYVGTDNGSIYSINEKTGVQQWATNIGSAISQTPSIDTAAGIVFAGDEAGKIVELNAATGAVITSLTTGGAAVTAAPSLSGGFVLVGAADGYLRTFTESTGKLAWKYNAGSAVQAIASTGVDVYVGTSAGMVDRLVEKTGAGSFFTPVNGGGVIGLAYSIGVAVATTGAGDVFALKDDQLGRSVYSHKVGTALDTAPAIVDGTIYVAGEDGNFNAFTTHGQSPDNEVAHLFKAQLRTQSRVPQAWANRGSGQARESVLSRAFAPRGPRTFPMHLDRVQATEAEALHQANAPGRTYLIGWGPVAIRANAYVARARAVAGLVAGTAVDTTPYSRALDDADVQREVARVIKANGWRVGTGARFIVLTAGSPLSARDYCSYHSAFDLDGSLAHPVIYGVIPAGTTEECGAFASQISRESKEMYADPFAGTQ